MRRRAGARWSWLLAVFVSAGASLFLVGLPGPSAHASAPTIVSLVFDDGTQDQWTTAFPIMQAHDMQGTFYVITGYISNLSGYMTLPELQSIHSAGDEIAAHTVLHPYLSQVSTDEATREICQSRDTLLDWGFPATDFAYPHSDVTSIVEGVTRQCGFNSARSDGQLTSPDGCLSGCPMAETIPPADPYYLRAPDSIQDTWSVSSIEQLVTQVESGGGGWTFLLFHHVCDNACDPYSITPANFSAVLDWLQTQNVTVEPVNQVIGGAVQPPVTPPSVAPAPPGANGVANPSLETADPYHPGTPACWTTNLKGVNDGAFSETSASHSGSVAENISISSFSNGAARLIVKQDLGQCAPSVVAGDTYVVSGWYRSTTPTRFGLWYRDPNGGWHYWTQSPQFAASGGWTQATWATPLVPSGAVALSFGMDIEAAGILTIDDLGLVDSGGPPVVSVTTPTAGAAVSGLVALGATATSTVGINRVDFLVNGSVVGSASTAPYTATWNSSLLSSGTVTITARATDGGGNQSTSVGVPVTVSNGNLGSLATGLQALWLFDDGSGTTVSDSSGNGHTGTTHGSGIWTSPGIAGGAIWLDGSKSYVSTSLPAPTGGQVTYAGWADRADTAGNYGLLGSSNGSGNGPLVQIPSGTNNVKFWRHTSGVSTTFSGAAPPPGRWFAWAVVDDTVAQTTTLYVNGVAVATNRNTATPATAGTVEVGGYAGTSSLFKGMIDEVGVWNRSLSASEVAALWNGGAGI